MLPVKKTYELINIHTFNEPRKTQLLNNKKKIFRINIMNASIHTNIYIYIEVDEKL